MYILDRIQELLDHSDPGHRVIIGISGPPAAGKSTLAQDIQWKLRLQSVDAVIAQADAFRFSPKVLNELDARDRRDHPSTFDVEGYVHLLTRLKNDADKTVYLPGYSTRYDHGVVGDIVATPETRVVIAEGDYLGFDGHGWDQVRILIDELHYLEGDIDVLHRRLLGKQLGKGKNRREADNWVTKVGLPNIFLVKNTEGNADHLISSNN